MRVSFIVVRTCVFDWGDCFFKRVFSSFIAKVRLWFVLAISGMVKRVERVPSILVVDY
jgi:hypothetical protein